MSAGFTPGPWEVRTTLRHHVPSLSHREILGGGDREGSPMVLGELYSGHDHDEPEDCVAEANARLIAAAPALYEALEGMMRHSCVADSAPEDKDGEDHIAESNALRALKLARGEV